jgi:predicted membrane protein
VNNTSEVIIWAVASLVLASLRRREHHQVLVLGFAFEEVPLLLPVADLVPQ